MNFQTVAIKSEGQLEEGQWYLIRGTHRDGLKFTPQVFFLRKKHLQTTNLGIPYIIGDLYFWAASRPQVMVKHRFWLPELNIPDQGLSDIHLERLPSSALRRALVEDQQVFQEHMVIRSQQPKLKGPGITPQLLKKYINLNN